MVELIRVDICMDASGRGSMMAMPREGQLAQVYRMFSFLRCHHNAVMVFDPSEPNIDESAFPKQDWTSSAYGECKEEIPNNAPEPRGKEVDIGCFMDADHAEDTVSRTSRTGFFIYINMAPIVFHSKKQTTIEISLLDSECVAMNTTMETSIGVRCKLRRTRVPINCPHTK